MYLHKQQFWLFYLIYLFVQWFFCYLAFILFIVLCVIFWRYKHIIFFFCLEILYLDNKQFLAISFDLFFCPIFFEILILFHGLVCFKMFLKTFFKNYGLSSLFLLIFVVSVSFSKSVQSISVLEKSPAPAGILFFFSHFLEVQTYNLFYFILIFCI